MSNQTSSSVLMTATTRWGGRLQKLGIHIWEMVAPIIAIDGMRPCLPDADGLSDTSFCPIQVLGWQLHSFSINGMVADHNIVCQCRLVMFYLRLPFLGPGVVYPFWLFCIFSCVLSPSSHTFCLSHLLHHRAVFARDWIYHSLRVIISHLVLIQNEIVQSLYRQLD